MSVYRTDRTPEFNSDVYTYGKIGERFFTSTFGPRLKETGKKITDVSDRKFWQKLDVDLIISDGESIIMDNIETAMNSSFKKIEVKVDTRAHDTGNLPFEVISHGGFGWSINTIADDVFIICCRDGIANDRIYAYEAYLIDMKKWKEFAMYAYNSFRDKPNNIQNEEIYDFLHKIDRMRYYGLIKKEIQLNTWI